ncbi:MAG: hypothetical protein M1833_004942 [Piccolia ochrophora]|nr:MAG: hypothetical protein M1833_004942 [Piccolia ochrophora]
MARPIQTRRGDPSSHLARPRRPPRRHAPSRPAASAALGRVATRFAWEISYTMKTLQFLLDQVTEAVEVAQLSESEDRDDILLLLELRGMMQYMLYRITNARDVSPSGSASRRPSLASPGSASSGNDQPDESEAPSGVNDLEGSPQPMALVNGVAHSQDEVEDEEDDGLEERGATEGDEDEDEGVAAEGELLEEEAGEEAEDEEAEDEEQEEEEEHVEAEEEEDAEDAEVLEEDQEEDEEQDHASGDGEGDSPAVAGMGQEAQDTEHADELVDNQSDGDEAEDAEEAGEYEEYENENEDLDRTQGDEVNSDPEEARRDEVDDQSPDAQGDEDDAVVDDAEGQDEEEEESGSEVQGDDAEVEDVQEDMPALGQPRNDAGDEPQGEDLGSNDETLVTGQAAFPRGYGLEEEAISEDELTQLAPNINADQERGPIYQRSAKMKKGNRKTQTSRQSPTPAFKQRGNATFVKKMRDLGQGETFNPDTDEMNGGGITKARSQPEHANGSMFRSVSTSLRGLWKEKGIYMDNQTRPIRPSPRKWADSATASFAARSQWTRLISTLRPGMTTSTETLSPNRRHVITWHVKPRRSRDRRLDLDVQRFIEWLSATIAKVLHEMWEALQISFDRTRVVLDAALNVFNHDGTVRGLIWGVLLCKVAYDYGLA